MNSLKLKNVIILLILPMLFSISGTPNPVTVEGKTSVTATVTVSHHNSKIDKKIKKLEKKLERIKENDEKGKQGNVLLILGVISLLAGILLVFSIANRDDDSIGEAVDGCFLLMLGGALGITGIILLIVGLVFSF